MNASSRNKRSVRAERHVKRTRRGELAATRVVSHRVGSKAAEAHLFVRANRQLPREQVIDDMQKRYKLTEGTARNWYQTFVKSAMDFAPRRV